MAGLGSRAAITFVALGALGGCEPRAATEVVVELRAEPALLHEARVLRVRVLGSDQSVVLERDKTLETPSGPLARIPLVPKGGDSTRRYVVVAELLDEGAQTLARIEAHGGYTDGELGLLELWFEDACAGKLDCGAARTCQAGSCMGACFSPRSADGTGRSLPTCGECERCDGGCARSDGMPCGCPGESCAGGACQPKLRVSHVDAGTVHSCAVIEGGDVYCWGSTSFSGNLDGKKGRLGTGDSGSDSPLPVLVAGAKGRSGLTLSGNLSCAIDMISQSRYCWGLNFAGELGGAPTSIVSTPLATIDPFELESIDSGFRHVCGISAAAELWCWGYNERGNLGVGSLEPSIATPTNVYASVKDAAAGGDHSCAIDLAGRLACWGYNDSGEVGVPGAAIIGSPLFPGCEPANSGNACFQDWKKVSAGGFHTCAIRASGELWCWGGNLNGQLGIGPPTSSYQEREPRRVVSDLTFADLDAGRSFTCALDQAGELYCWGLNEDRQLGIPDLDFVAVPTKLAVEAPGGWRALGLGEYHACAIRADRTLWCWGRNSDGQIGIGSVTEQPIARPTRVCF
jgi:alpha-tubulin suppressor-like RCC1 family protein